MGQFKVPDKNEYPISQNFLQVIEYFVINFRYLRQFILGHVHARKRALHILQT